MQEYTTKDSGKRQDFDTGTKRDTQEGKPRYELIPATALRRIAGLYARGAIKYDEWNWSKGMPYSRFIASTMRHLFQYILGDRDEDHLAAVCFNIMAIMHFEEVGRDAELDDIHKHYMKREPACISSEPAPVA